MKTKRWFYAVALVVGLSFCSWAHAGGHGEKRPVKKGILLVAFGSSVPEAQVSFKNIDQKVKEAFPGIAVRWAYTSSIIRHKLAQQGQRIDSPELALARMMDEAFTHVAVQSLHTIGGEEFHDLQRNAHAFAGMAGGFDRLLVGYPLLATERDMERVTEAVLQTLPAEREKAEAVVLMGHGTPHPSNAFYAALMFHLQRRDSHIFVGTVEGSPDIQDIKAMLLEEGLKKAYLVPFMSVAGDHALNDMAGDAEDSWKSVLDRAGIASIPVLKGTAEYDAFVAIWLDHLREAIQRLCVQD